MGPMSAGKAVLVARQAGDSFRPSYMIKAFGTGETVGAGWVAGQGIAGFYGMVDALTRKVKEDLKLTRIEIAVALAEGPPRARPPLE